MRKVTLFVTLLMGFFANSNGQSVSATATATRTSIKVYATLETDSVGGYLFEEITTDTLQQHVVYPDSLVAHSHQVDTQIVHSTWGLSQGTKYYIWLTALSNAYQQPNATLCLTVITPSGPVPTPTSISPSTAIAGGAGFTITIFGTDFTRNSVAHVVYDSSGSSYPLTTTYVDSVELKATVTSSDVANAGTDGIEVVNGAIVSSVLPFIVSYPTPVLTSISPNEKVQGSYGFTMTFYGKHLRSESVAYFDSLPLLTTFMDTDELQAWVPNTDVDSVGTAIITVMTGTKTSNGLIFTTNPIHVPVPVVTSLSQDSVGQYSSAVSMTVMGDSFLNGAQVYFNGTALSTQWINSRELSFTIPASFLQTSGSFTITVGNGSVVSAAGLTFIVNPFVPTTVVVVDQAQCGYESLSVVALVNSNVPVILWAVADEGKLLSANPALATKPIKIGPVTDTLLTFTLDKRYEDTTRLYACALITQSVQGQTTTSNILEANCQALGIEGVFTPQIKVYETSSRAFLFELPNGVKSDVGIYDQNGKLLLVRNDISGEMEIATPTMLAGLYIYKIIGPDFTCSGKILKN